MTTGEIIITERTKMNLNQLQLAEAIGYKNRRSISQIERGENKITKKMAERLSEFFGIPVDELINGNDAPFIFTSEKRAKISKNRRTKKYCDKNYDYYKARFYKGDKEKAQKYAEENGYDSFNDFIMTAIKHEMNR